MNYIEQLEQQNEELKNRLAKLEAEHELLSKISFECLKKSDSCSIEDKYMSKCKILLVKNDSTAFAIDLYNSDVDIAKDLLGKVINDKLEYQKKLLSHVSDAINTNKKETLVI